MTYPKYCTITASLFICAFLLLPITSLFGQGNPQAEQDCINAIPVCNQIITQPNSYTGEGADPTEIDPNISCLGTGEENNVWYRIDVLGAGSLNFTIEPINSFDDYDFAVYNLTNANCSDIRTNDRLEISCNYSALAGPTGANLPGGLNSQGAGGLNRNAPIPVLSGETYVINISNFSSTAGGFQLNLTASTAIFANSGNASPTLDTLYQDGNSDTLILAFKEPILCSSLSAQSLNISLNSSPSSIDSLWSERCEAGDSFGSFFKITLNDPLAALGRVTAALVDTVQGICGNFGFGGSVQTQLPLSFDLQAQPNILCKGDSSLIYTDFSTPNYTALWLPDSLYGDSIWVRPDSNQYYRLQIIDSTAMVLATDSILVELYPIPMVNLGADFSFCTDSVLIGASAGPWLSYSWEDGSQDSSRWIRESGTYSLEVTDFNGCKAIDTVEISQELPVMSDFNWIEDSFRVAFSDSSMQADSLFWDFGDGNFSREQNPTHSYDSAGTYTVSLISVNSCSRDTLSQIIRVNGWPTNIPPNILTEFLSIRPQPAVKKVSLHFSHEAFFGERLVLYSLAGKRLRDLGEIREEKIVLERGNLAPGIYILRIGNLAKKLWFE